MSESVSSSTSVRSAASPLRFVLWGVLGLVVLAVIVWALVRALQPSDPLAGAIESNRYQAVFLTNGQVYFGRLTAPGGDFYYLRHVYYLTAASSAKGQAATPQLKKLTGDLHGPEDEVVINRQQILYVENLNPKGRAAQILSGPGS